MDRKQLPNMLTGLRIVAAFLLAITVYGSPGFMVLHCLCGITDVLDGVLARRYKAADEFGASFDSIADVLWMLVVTGKMLVSVRFGITCYIAAGVIISIKIGTMAAGKLSRCAVVCFHTYANKVSGCAVFTIPLFYGIIGTSAVYQAVLIVICTYAAIEECILALVIKSENPNQKSWFL